MRKLNLAFDDGHNGCLLSLPQAMALSATEFAVLCLCLVQVHWIITLHWTE